jgi:hypothetical protein
MIPHFNYYPAAGTVIDQSDSRVTWNGRAWMLNGRVYGVPSSHRLVGRPGGPLDGWTYDWGRHAWMEPDHGPPRPSSGPVAGPIRRPGGFQPQRPQSQPQPQTPTVVSEKKECPVEKKDQNVLEYLTKHPIAPLLGGFMLLGTQFAEEPVPPTIPDDLPEATAKQWMMIYSQNLQRFQRRMTLFENIGKLLLGYADTNAVMAALPPKKAG